MWFILDKNHVDQFEKVNFNETPFTNKARISPKFKVKKIFSDFGVSWLGLFRCVL